jgi:hypothetical protein
MGTKLSFGGGGGKCVFSFFIYSFRFVSLHELSNSRPDIWRPLQFLTHIPLTDFRQ